MIFLFVKYIRSSPPPTSCLPLDAHGGVEGRHFIAGCHETWSSRASLLNYGAGLTGATRRGQTAQADELPRPPPAPPTAPFHLFTLRYAILEARACVVQDYRQGKMGMSNILYPDNAPPPPPSRKRPAFRKKNGSESLERNTTPLIDGSIICLILLWLLSLRSCSIPASF